jgi:HSP20 family protein
MILGVLERNGFWNEVDRIQEELTNSLLRGGVSRYNGYPSINVYNSEDEAIMTALVPGYSSEEIEVSVVGNRVILKGNASKSEKAEKGELVRQEFLDKEFVRTLELPFPVESGKVDARFKNGILTIRLPKAESEKPKKISISVQ